MKNLVNLLIVVLLISTSFVSAKGKYGTVGKVYTTDRAEELYGAVQKSISMDKQDLLAMLEECENYVYFKVKNDEVIIADDNKNVLTSNKIYITSSILTHVTKNDVIGEDEPLNLVSKNRMLEIINSDNTDSVKFEVRDVVQTISSSMAVLELAIISW